MSKDVNKVILIGRLGQDVELRYTGSGKAVANMSLATSRKWKSGDGADQEKTEWHRLVAWDKLAEICNQYLGKGSMLYVEGYLETRKWQDKDGSDRYSTEIKVVDMSMLGSTGDRGSQGNTDAQKQADASGSGSNKGQSSAASGGFDEIPFAPVKALF